MENKLQQLKKVIWKANPSILELKFGCKVDAEGKWTIVNERKDIAGTYNAINTIFKKTKLGIVTRGYFENLGRPIRLADVLVALEEESKKITKYMDKRYLFITEGQKDILAIWNLKKDFDNQSDECKEFLDKLLVK